MIPTPIPILLQKAIPNLYSRVLRINQVVVLNSTLIRYYQVECSFIRYVLKNAIAKTAISNF